MNASSVFTRPLIFQLLPLSLRFFISHPFSLSNSHSAFFPDVFALSTHKQKTIKKRSGNGDVARGEQEKSLTMQINRRNTRDNVKLK